MVRDLSFTPFVLKCTHIHCIDTGCILYLLYLHVQHGRVKLKSTAQQEEEKRKEREKKLKIYVAARDACFSKVFRKHTFHHTF